MNRRLLVVLAVFAAPACVRVAGSRPDAIQPVPSSTPAPARAAAPERAPAPKVPAPTAEPAPYVAPWAATPTTSAATTAPAVSTTTVKFPKPPRYKHPRVAVIIDDFGRTSKHNPPDEDWMTLDEPMTFTVIPREPRTIIVAQLAKQYGKELMIHFPFDPYENYDPNDVETSSDAIKAVKLMRSTLKLLPNAVGLNNHRSLLATQNRPLMHAFMRRLRPTGLFFVDSMVSSMTVAGAEARAAGIRTASNSIFLDTIQVHTREFCVDMLAIAIKRAQRRGRGVVIGHHYYKGTFECLRDEMPRYKEQGIVFVPASKVVR